MKHGLRIGQIAGIFSIAFAGFVMAGAERSEAVTLDFVDKFDGNGCSGSATEVAPGLVQGDIETGECTYDLSEAILKFDDFDDSDTAGNIIKNSEYSSFDPGWIDFGFTSDFYAGDLSYKPEGDKKIGMTAVYFKSGSHYYLYEFSEVFFGSDTLTFSWATDTFNLSNAVFFNFEDDGGDFDVPVPAGLPLVLSGLGLFGLMRARKRKQA